MKTETINKSSGLVNMRKRVIELYRSGHNFCEIGREVGINRTTVRYYIRRYAKVGDIALEPYLRKSTVKKAERVSQEKFDKAVLLCKTTPMRLTSIARTVGVQYHRLYYLIRTQYPEIIESRRTYKKTN